ncbi:hypothetical protein PAAG_11472 [Paracoccidioides lutzii Pb01]|uniref:Uncharacterized protein n=1 Tax=Paracoccidioides lutzii (strain ATCC MYA-826 / Pb01) TaxID=502779 RepID=A0A0A2VLM8_PARBA|nr:hypothetical protein PAAG_11472 [Paracoccidioides lutzii Pb01]KGQ01754.1 hypothetical protein PAAG_11472 [Paracoccidioides lutzii Pb01]
MNVIWLLSLLFFGPILLLIVFLALSSCLGDGFRAHLAGFSVNPREGAYGRSYLRTMTNSGSAMSEHVELEDMIRDQVDYDSDDPRQDISYSFGIHGDD